MNGLLLKDLLILKANWKTYAFLVAFYAAFAFGGNPTFFSTMLAVILMICPMTSFSADELARWDQYAAALPGGRRAVVRAKYQLLFLILGGAFVLSCAVNLLVSLFGRGESTFGELALAALACAAAAEQRSLPAFVQVRLPEEPDRAGRRRRGRLWRGGAHPRIQRQSAR